jgi:hypothetical protein
MYARRITPGRYVPSSSSACSLGRTLGHCSHSASIALPIRTGGAPVRRHLQQRTRQSLGNFLHRRRRCRLHLVDRLRRSRPDLPSRSRVLLRVAPRGLSAVAIGRPSCTAVSSTGTASPCPPGLDPTRSAGITPPSGTTRSSDFCWAIEPSSSRPPAYRPSRAGTQQISWGEMLRSRRDRVATTPSTTTGIGHRCCGSARPPRDALRRFTLVRHHDAPMASFRPALAEVPQRITKPHWDRPPTKNARSRSAPTSTRAGSTN